MYYIIFFFYSWFDRNGDKIGTTGNIFVDGNNLVFKHPAQIDTGNYTCRASNLAGIKNQTVWTIVSGRYFLPVPLFLQVVIQI